jgi:hypothetical protein
MAYKIMMTTMVIASTMAAPISTNDVYYYYNEFDVSTCGQPVSGIPCIGEMYFTKLPELQYVPYYVWYKFEKKSVDIWFNYNNTDVVNVGSALCDKKQHSLVVNKNSFSQILIDTGVLEHFSFSFDITCGKKGNIVTLFDLSQTTYLNEKLLSTFPLVWFKDWEIIEEENEPDFNTEDFFSVPSSHPPPNTPCKYCDEKK